MRTRPLGFTVALLALAACDKQVAAPVAPLDEVAVATSVSAQAQTAMGGEANGPASILRTLVQQVRAGDNADAKALLTRADDMSARATATGNADLAAQAHGMVLQAVVLVFPNATQRIANVTRAGLEQARTALGSRDAPRVRSALDQVAALLAQSASAQAAGRNAIALDCALRASELLGKLADSVRG